jgi:hypothetical protein
LVNDRMCIRDDAVCVVDEGIDGTCVLPAGLVDAVVRCEVAHGVMVVREGQVPRVDVVAYDAANHMVPYLASLGAVITSELIDLDGIARTCTQQPACSAPLTVVIGDARCETTLVVLPDAANATHVLVRNGAAVADAIVSGVTDTGDVVTATTNDVGLAVLADDVQALLVEAAGLVAEVRAIGPASLFVFDMKPLVPEVVNTLVVPDLAPEAEWAALAVNAVANPFDVSLQRVLGTPQPVQGLIDVAPELIVSSHLLLHSPLYATSWPEPNALPLQPGVRVAFARRMFAEELIEVARQPREIARRVLRRAAMHGVAHNNGSDVVAATTMSANPTVIDVPGAACGEDFCPTDVVLFTLSASTSLGFVPTGIDWLDEAPTETINTRVSKAVQHGGLEGLSESVVALAADENGMESAVVNEALDAFPVWAVDVENHTCDDCDLTVLSAPEWVAWSTPAFAPHVATLLQLASLSSQASESVAVRLVEGSSPTGLIHPDTAQDVDVAGWTRRQIR